VVKLDVVTPVFAPLRNHMNVGALPPKPIVLLKVTTDPSHIVAVLAAMLMVGVTVTKFMVIALLLTTEGLTHEALLVIRHVTTSPWFNPLVV
jgi:hypothetical protein